MYDGAAMRRRTAVAIPACNEAERIGTCLDALYSQASRTPDEIVLLVNNSTDDTAGIARALAAPPGVRLHVMECELAPGEANAGHARRLAMDAAAALLGAGDVLLTTDADSVMDGDWIAANLAAIERGADAVAGWIELDPIDWGRIPLALHEADSREAAYDLLCDEIHHRIDPDPFDPWPRHTQHSGASLAMTVAQYRTCGGVPRVASGEDRALVAALRGVDARIRHAPEVHGFVSGRIDGRAQGGMAETIRRRMNLPDTMLDDRLESAAACARRAAARRDARRAYNGMHPDPAAFAAWLGVTAAFLDEALHQPWFGKSWQRLEQAAPALRHELLAVADLPAEMAAAQAVLARLAGERRVMLDEQ